MRSVVKDGRTIIECTPPLLPPTCPECKSKQYLKTGRRYRKFLDKPDESGPTELKILSQRFRCASCGFNYSGELPGMSASHSLTERFESLVFDASMRNAFTVVANDLALAPSTVRSVFESKAEALEASMDMSAPQILVVCTSGGKRQFTVLFDGDSGRVIDLVRGSDASTVSAAVARLKSIDGVRRVVVMGCKDGDLDAALQTLGVRIGYDVAPADDIVFYSQVMADVNSVSRTHSFQAFRAQVLHDLGVHD